LLLVDTCMSAVTCYYVNIKADILILSAVFSYIAHLNCFVRSGTHLSKMESMLWHFTGLVVTLQLEVGLQSSLIFILFT